MEALKVFLWTLAGAFLYVSCTLPGDTSARSGTLRVLLTDTPADFEAVRIEIRELWIDQRTDTGGNDSGWRIIAEQPTLINLLELTNGNVEVLGEAKLDAGHYNRMKLVLGDQNELIIDGESHRLATPGGRQPGLILRIDAEIEPGKTLAYLLDVDASRSVVPAGDTGGYILNPVIKTVPLAGTGAIGGSVEPADALPWVYAIAGGDTVAGTRASPDGKFLMIGLDPGAYQVSVAPAGNLYSSAVISNIKTTGSDTTMVEAFALVPTGN